MVEWFVLTVTHQGPHAAASAFKDWATQAQMFAVGDSRQVKPEGHTPLLKSFLRGSLLSSWTRHAAWTFSSLGRSLPPSRLEGDKKELEEWSERLWSSEEAPSQETLDSIYRFTKTMVGRLYKKDLKRVDREPLYGALKLNVSACLERSKAKGGTYAHYRERALAEEVRASALTPEGSYPFVDRTDPNAGEVESMSAMTSKSLASMSLDDFLRPSRKTNELLSMKVPKAGDPIKAVSEELPVGLQAVALERVAQAIAEDDIEDYLRRDEIPKMRPLVIRERGQKKRLATISEACLVVAGQRINRALLRLLEKSETASYSLRGETDTPACITQGVQAYSSHQDFEFLSTDLSAASDYLHHKVNEAVWMGIWDVIGQEFPYSYKWVGQKLVGPMMLDPATPDLPDSLKSRLGSPSTRGALMGLPLAWPILTIVNDWAARHASSLEGAACFETCGDDMSAAWTRSMSEEYFRNLERAGLRVNKKKTFRSTSATIFVEKLFVLSKKLKVERLPAIPQGSAALFGKPTLVPDSSDILHHRIISRMKRPTLSALAQARRHASPGDDTMPSWATLAQTLSEEMKECSPAQAKLLLPAARSLHPDAFRMWHQSGLPLHWPHYLGGWGLPGKPDAPSSFRKAAAVLITQNRPELLQSFARIFSGASLRGAASSVVKSISQEIDASRLANVGELSRTRREIERDATARITSYFALLEDKTRKGPPLKFSSIVSQIKSKVKKLCGQWGSVQPMDPSKAVREAEALLLLSQEENLPLDVTKALERHQVFDEVLKKDRQKLPPEQRARLFVRSTRERHSPAMATSLGSSTTALARASLLDAKDVVAGTTPDRAGDHPGGPTYSFRDNAREWSSARRCRTLLQTANSVEMLEACLEDVQREDAALPSRDEAGRFVTLSASEGLNPLRRGRSGAEKPRPDKSPKKDEFSHLPLRSDRKAARLLKAKAERKAFASDGETSSENEMG
jgi:hypothetical protein